jgi:hypothetical protein
MFIEKYCAMLYISEPWTLQGRDKKKKPDWTMLRVKTGEKLKYDQ